MEKNQKSRVIYLVRHAKSEANVKNLPALENKNAPLLRSDEKGEILAKKLGEKFREMGIDPEKTSAAASEFRRAQETAELAGFRNLKIYPQLNEVELPNKKYRETIENIVKFAENPEKNLAEFPEKIKNVGENFAKNPPPETVMFSHGLAIASIFQRMTGENFAKKFGRPYPDYGEIVKIEIEIEIPAEN